MYLNIFQPLDKHCFNVYPIPKVKGLVPIDLSMISSSSSKLVPLTATVDYHSLTLDLWSKLLILSVISTDGGSVCVQTSRILPPCLSVCDRDLKHFTSVLLLSGASVNVPHYLPSLFHTVEERWMEGAEGRERGRKRRGRTTLSLRVRERSFGNCARSCGLANSARHEVCTFFSCCCCVLNVCNVKK